MQLIIKIIRIVFLEIEKMELRKIVLDENTKYNENVIKKNERLKQSIDKEMQT